MKSFNITDALFNGHEESNITKTLSCKLIPPLRNITLDMDHTLTIYQWTAHKGRSDPEDPGHGGR